MPGGIDEIVKQITYFRITKNVQYFWQSCFIWLYKEFYQSGFRFDDMTTPKKETGLKWKADKRFSQNACIKKHVCFEKEARFFEPTFTLIFTVIFNKKCLHFTLFIPWILIELNIPFIPPKTHIFTHTYRLTLLVHVSLPFSFSRSFTPRPLIVETYSCFLIYKVVQIWPGQTVTCLHTNRPGHIWTTLCVYVYIYRYIYIFD